MLRQERHVRGTVNIHSYLAVKTDMYRMVLIKSMKTRHVTHPHITL